MPKVPEWLGPRAPNRTAIFMAIKYTLTVILFLTLAMYVVCTIYMLAAPTSTKEYLKSFDTKEELDAEHLNAAYAVMIASMIFAIIVILVGLMGVVKEHFCIATTYAVLTCLGFLLSLFTLSSIWRVLWGAFVSVVSVCYAVMIRRANRAPNVMA